MKCLQSKRSQTETGNCRDTHTHILGGKFLRRGVCLLDELGVDNCGTITVNGI